MQLFQEGFGATYFVMVFGFRLLLSISVHGPSYCGFIRSISLLIPWRIASPSHQRQWCWLCEIGMSWSSLRKDFNNLCHACAFMVTTPATRVPFGGDYSSLLATRWDSLGWCDGHDCIAHLLTCFAPWNEVIILMLYVFYKWSQINPTWVSDSQCDCMYVLAYYK